MNTPTPAHNPSRPAIHLLALASSCGLATALEVINTTPANDRADLSAQAGQTFTTPVLGIDNQLDTLTVRGPQDNPGDTELTLKIWEDTDGDFTTWDPDTLVATSTNSLALSNTDGDHVFTFDGEVLTGETVYAFSFSDGTDDHVGFRPGLTNAEGVALTDGALFSGGAEPFGGAFDVSFILSTNSGIPSKEIVWTAATDGTWDTTTTNWRLPDSTPATFNHGDDVIFDDTAADGTVTVDGLVEPESILVENDTLPYTLGGAPIDGPAALTKDGPGTLTLTAGQDFSGGTTLLGGGIVAGDGATSGEIGGGPVSLAADTTLTISRSDLLDYNATPKLRNLSGEGNLILDGGGTLFIYPGGGTEFNAPDTWAGFAGEVTLLNGSELQSIRNGATGRGTGTLVLGDATTSGALSQVEGNWTWTNTIETVGPDNRVINRSSDDFPRSLKLQGPITGSGNLTLEDAAGSMSNLNDGFVITNDVTLGGTLTIDVGTPVRIGGVPGEVDVADTGLDADSSGSLGATAVVNEGVLTFSRTDEHTVSAPVSGMGDIRIGMPSDAERGDTSTQVVTFPGAAKTHEGITFVESGTLLVNGTLPNSFIDVNPEGSLGGTGTVTQSTLLYGALAPGDPVGTLTFGDELIFIADSSYTWEISDFTGAAGTGYDTTSGADLQFEGTGSNPVTIRIEPASVTNFSETPATFTLATSAAPITTIDLDGFVIDDSAFAAATGSAGSWDVQLGDDSLSLELAYTPGTPPDDFAEWIDGFFPGETDPAVVGFDADPDGDGVGNGIENFLGTAPNAFSAGLTPARSTATSLTATHSRSNEVAGDVTGGYEWSSDLAEWHASGDTDDNGVTATVSPEVTDDQEAPLNDTVEVTATVTDGPATRLFLRVVATSGAP